MSSSCSTCSKVTLHCVVWNAVHAAGGALGWRAASMTEAVRGRVALTCHQCGAAGSAGVGREARAGGGGFFVGPRRWEANLGSVQTGKYHVLPYSLLPLFLNISLFRYCNKRLHTEQNGWIYTPKYVYIHPYVVVHLEPLKRLIFRNGGSTIITTHAYYFYKLKGQ